MGFRSGEVASQSVSRVRLPQLCLETLEDQDGSRVRPCCSACRIETGTFQRRNYGRLGLVCFYCINLLLCGHTFYTQFSDSSRVNRIVDVMLSIALLVMRIACPCTADCRAAEVYKAEDIALNASTGHGDLEISSVALNAMCVSQCGYLS